MTEVRITPDLLNKFKLSVGKRPKGVPDGTLIEYILADELAQGVYWVFPNKVEELIWDCKEVFDLTGGCGKSIVFWRLVEEQG